jgi:predicted house-cleaning noncanonical NTP pyrophosphatase (MazG superfamily)
VARRDFNKLVRDRIPESIEANGSTCSVDVLRDDEEFRRALRAKLVEEATEAASASDDDLVTELADLQEVIDALIAASGLTVAAVQTLQRQRRAERGGFARRLRLLWTE